MNAKERLFRLCVEFGKVHSNGCKMLSGVVKLPNGRIYAAPRVHGGQLLCSRIGLNNGQPFQSVGNYTMSNELAELFLESVLNRKFMIYALETLVHKRYSLKKLKQVIDCIFGGNCNLVLADLTEDESSVDYRIIFCNQCGDFDIWFLPMVRFGSNGESMYITEVGYDFSPDLL